MKLVFAIILLCAPSLAQTKVYLHDAASPIQQSPAIVFRKADSTAGASAAATAITAGVTGPIAGQYWPISTANVMVTKTSGGTPTIWLSAPLSAGVTISGTITPNIYCLESATSANAGFRYQIMRWTPRGGFVSSLGISADATGSNSAGVTECPTSTAAAKTAPTITPTSTAFSIGDRIGIVIYADDCNAASSCTHGSGSMTLRYDWNSTNTADTYVQFTEAISFASDTNNSTPPRAVTQ